MLSQLVMLKIGRAELCADPSPLLGSHNCRENVWMLTQVSVPRRRSSQHGTFTESIYMPAHKSLEHSVNRLALMLDWMKSRFLL